MHERRTERAHAGRSHDDTRSGLRVAGILILLVGGVFTLVGFVSFFSSFGDRSGPPEMFWCAFVGLPLLGLGGTLARLGYLGAWTRYVAREVTPAATESVNAMADGTRGAIRNVAAAVGEGLGLAGGRAAPARVLRCHKCNTDSDVDSRFCKRCGVALTKMRACASCAELNDPDARFCDHCGKSMVA